MPGQKTQTFACLILYVCAATVLLSLFKIPAMPISSRLNILSVQRTSAFLVVVKIFNESQILKLKSRFETEPD